MNMNTEAFISGYIGKEAARGDQLIKALRNHLGPVRYYDTGQTATKWMDRNALKNALNRYKETGKIDPASKRYLRSQLVPAGEEADILDALLSRGDLAKVTGTGTRTAESQLAADQLATKLKDIIKANKSRGMGSLGHGTLRKTTDFPQTPRLLKDDIPVALAYAKRMTEKNPKFKYQDPQAPERVRQGIRHLRPGPDKDRYFRGWEDLIEGKGLFRGPYA
jgi:hypothetical protein